MRKFTTLSSLIAPLLEDDIDTDTILPARFLLLMEKAGLGKHVFSDRRRAGQAAPFILDQPQFAQTQILMAGARFGVGSSREQAVWALADFGIQCVIAPSFGEIFFANCFNNGILAIRAGPDLYEILKSTIADTKPVTVNLESECITPSDGKDCSFEIASHHKSALLSGRDEIDMILQDDCADIAAFETEQREREPWLYLDNEQRAFLNAPLP